MSALERYDAAESLTLQQALVLLKEMADELREIREQKRRFKKAIQEGLVEFFRERNERLDREERERQKWWNRLFEFLETPVTLPTIPWR